MVKSNITVKRYTIYCHCIKDVVLEFTERPWYSTTFYRQQITASLMNDKSL